MPALPRLSADRLRDRSDAILDAAEQEFGRGGFADVSISDVARTAGVSDGLIYRYFENKRALRDAVLTRFYGRVLASARQAVAAQPSFEARLFAMVETHLQAFRDHRALCRLFIAEVRVASDYPGSPLQELNRRYTGVMERVLQQGVAERAVSAAFDPRLVRDMLFGGMEHVAWRSVNGRGVLDVPSAARAICALLLRGLQAQPT